MNPNYIVETVAMNKLVSNIIVVNYIFSNKVVNYGWIGNSYTKKTINNAIGVWKFNVKFRDND